MEKLKKLSWHFEYIDTPIGVIEICGNEKAITSILFLDDLNKESYVNYIEKENYKINNNHIGAVSEVVALSKKQLEEYFKGERKSFQIPIEFEGTEFQKKSWDQLTKIPYGETISYKEQAIAMGREKSVRAVGAANGKNKISIIIPCHRVIGSNGKLTGYAGGIERKAWLLEHERKHK
ncbi:methylated-DNA--[protein]-cysteine S-methyltransferase [Oceanirhabdus sp. W0125-5]|uniref:methylated-DNA--[protein]-cysteine S-methyltransferase n=1 Tax=Oceanirhabdus sp. W0125-5 TaxID=2999116 RepID=UPI0022F2CDA3|nr:methylated-DNA--[protein]-cysteine S-methyltransferase [Oceanirhabdus sp. W0125-5]WBW97851.1 methylated-DNA--[protein]-cysteine S-methyltransferase [Oceanirhabdus sp. W0125-5]